MSSLGDGGGKGLAGAVLVILMVPVAVIISLALLPVIFSSPPPAVAGTCVAVAEGESGSGPRVPNDWGDDVVAAAKVAGMPPEILAAQLEAESDWNTRAVSPRGAAGLAQAMPGTWAQYGEGDPFDPVAAIRFQGVYMKALMGLAEPHADSPDEQIKMALAAYNWGDGNMGSVGWDWTQGPAETTNYVPKILTLAQVSISAECAPVLPGDIDLGTGEWTNPLPGGTMTGAGAFGPRNVPGLPAWAQNHVGIDLATIFPGPAGRVLAPTDLRVTAIYEPDGCVMARQTSAPGFGFAFCHMDTIGVREGQDVKRGGELGVEGTKATSVGGTSVRHLHTELYLPGNPDPEFPGPSAPGVTDPLPIYRAKGAV